MREPPLAQRHAVICCLCMRRPAETNEHVPGRHAANTGPVLIRYLTGATSSGGLRHRVRKAPDGFSVPTLCRKCNSRTGSRYGAAYGDFVRQFEASGTLKASDGRTFIGLRGIRPARVAKQMISMLITSQPKALPPQLDHLREYVLRRDAVLPASDSSDAFGLFLYRNVSRNGRIVPMGSIMELFAPGPVEDRSVLSAEVSWPPVGLVFAMQGATWLRARGLVDITDWGRQRFNAIENVQILVPDFEVTTDHPLGFGQPDDVERWRSERGVVWAIARVDDPELPNATAMIWRRDR